MAEYIKRDEVNAVLQNVRTKYALLAMSGAEHVIAKSQELIDEIPADDVRENVRGKWIGGAQDFESGKTHECSICGGFIDYNKGGADDYYFCPYCGADMREVKE